MALIPHNNPLLHSLNHTEVKGSHRYYLGLSMIGNPCHRYLQYCHYWAYDIYYDNRIQRIFNTGHEAEEFMVDDLMLNDIEVTNRQDVLTGTAGHWKGHHDGIAHFEGKKLLEMKTHNDKSFKDVVKKKVKASKPTHYAQMQSYMGYSKLTEALYMAYNKNDSKYYTEIVEFDEEFFKELKHKEFEVISADVLLPRIGNNSSTWFECKMCDARNVCFRKKEASRNCRTCRYVDVLPEGKWACTVNKDSRVIDTVKQRKGCTLYEQAIMFREVK